MYRSILATMTGAILLMAAPACKKSDDSSMSPGQSTSDPAGPTDPQANHPRTPERPPSEAPDREPPGAADQGTPPAGGTAPPAGDGEPVTDQELDEFAEAVEGVRSIQQTYEARINAAKSQEEATLAQQEAMGLMQEEVEKAGLTMQEYSALAERVGRDAALQERLEARLMATEEQ